MILPATMLSGGLVDQDQVNGYPRSMPENRRKNKKIFFLVLFALWCMLLLLRPSGPSGGS
jgi:hypothetical protein